MAKKFNKKQLEELVNELQKQNEELAWNDRFGCWSRQGFEKRIWSAIADKATWIIFMDVDNMHALNDKHTHAGVNALIKSCLATLRKTDYVAGQWESGDEFAICIVEDGSHEKVAPRLLCERLRADFLAKGLPATFGIAQVTSRILAENVEPAQHMVEEAKKANKRGRIYFE